MTDKTTEDKVMWSTNTNASVLPHAAQNIVHIFTLRGLCDGKLVLCAGLLILNFHAFFFFNDSAGVCYKLV
jgi:hypothetical protein